LWLATFLQVRIPLPKVRRSIYARRFNEEGDALLASAVEANCPSAATISARLPVCVLRHITVSRPRLRPDDNQADFGVCPINRQENG
jgi:hypothetical protein